jgi:hypothetical protein
MMDEFIRRMLISRDLYLRSLVDEAAPTEGVLADFLTTLWYRSLFGDDAPAARKSEVLTLEDTGQG